MGAKDRRMREKESRKAQILDTARALLLKKGLNATTINQMAKEAELSVGAIYFYFKSKEDIYAELQIEGSQLLSKILRKAVENQSSPEEQIRRIAKAYLKFSEEQSNYFDLSCYFISSREVIFSEELKIKVDKEGRVNLEYVEDAVRKAVDEGIFKKVNPRRQSIIFWSTLFGMIQFKKLESTMLQHENHRSLYLEAVERFLEAMRR